MQSYTPVYIQGRECGSDLCFRCMVFNLGKRVSIVYGAGVPPGAVIWGGGIWVDQVNVKSGDLDL